MLGIVNFFYMAWVFVKYYTTCDGTNCSIWTDFNVNIPTSLMTYDFLITTLICMTFFVREGIRYSEDEIPLNFWKYLAYTLLFSIPTAFALFIPTFLLSEEMSMQQFLKEYNPKSTRLSESTKRLKEEVVEYFGRVNPFFFITYFVYFCISVILWVPSADCLFVSLVNGDISEHYNNLANQFITRAFFILWMEIPLLVAAIANSKGYNFNTALFVGVMVLSSFSISTCLAIFLLYREWENPISFNQIQKKMKGNVPFQKI